MMILYNMAYKLARVGRHWDDIHVYVSCICTSIRVVLLGIPCSVMVVFMCLWM